MTISQEISALAADQLIATDEGTHGMPGTIKIYEKLDGRRYGVRYHGGAVIGRCPADTESEHGRMRHIRHDTPAHRRGQIEHLRQAEIEAGKAAESLANRRAELAKGWDGYQFVGVARGAAILASM